MYLILIYDISQSEDTSCRSESSRIMRNTFKICKKYLTHIQKSVFEGELSEAQLMKLKNELKVVLRADIDSCIVFTSRSDKWMKKDYITKELNQTSQFI